MVPIVRGKPDFNLEELEAAAHCLSTGLVATGPQIEAFEKAVADYIGVKYALATSNGWSAIFILIKAMRYPWRETVMPTTVCRSVYDSVYWAEGSPRIVDCNEKDFNINVDAAKKAISKHNTKAILAPHLRGIPSDMDELMDLGVPIIEDIAQSFGAKYKGKMTGSIGHAAICSFYPTKIMSSVDGGMILTNDEDLYERARVLRYHREEGANNAFNFKLNNINAAIGLVQLERMEEFKKHRADAYNMYKTHLQGGDMYKLVSEDKEVVHDKYIFPVYEHSVEEYHTALEKAEIQPIKATHLLHKEIDFGGVVGGKDAYKNAERLAKHMLALPIYPRLQDHQLVHIVKTIKEIHNTN